MGLRKIPGRKVWIYQTKVNGKTWARSTEQTNKRLARKEIARPEQVARGLENESHSSSRLSEAIAVELERVRQDVSERQAERVG